MNVGSSDKSLLMVMAPSDIFSGDESITPTPGLEGELTGGDSQVSTPRLSDSHFAEAMAAATEGKVCNTMVVVAVILYSHTAYV